MLTVYNCIVHAHDLRLVGLAAVICLFASFTAVSLLHHVRSSQGHMRTVWLAVSATSTGFGIWATHFIAMLAFSPGIPNAYNIALTFLSLIAAILLTGAGLVVALNPKVPAGAWLGGAIVGGGIAAMHYTGMAAFEIQGRIVWDPVLVVMSIVLGGVLGAVALPVGLRGASMKSKVLGALLLTVAICSHHFTAMAAASHHSRSDDRGFRRGAAVGLLAIAVSFRKLHHHHAGASRASPSSCATAAAPSSRPTACAASPMPRSKDFWFATAKRSSPSTTASRRWSETSTDQVVGTALAQYLPDEGTRGAALRRHQCGHRGRVAARPMVRATPSSLFCRPVDFAGKPHHAIAVRDLQARKNAEQHIRFLAHHDALTGVPNRSSFNMRLDQEIASAIADKHKLAVLCLDLDRFKEVNDLFGHAAGDKVLQSRRAAASARVLDEGQMLARLERRRIRHFGAGLGQSGSSRPRRRSDPRGPADRQQHAKPMRRSPPASASPYVPTTPPTAHSLLTPCRHRALSRQARRPRNLPLLRGGDGRSGSRSPPARARSAPRHLAQ